MVALTTTEKLLVIQDRDRKIARLRKESQDIPARKKHIEDRVQDKKNAVHTAHEELKKKLSAAKQVELEVASHQERISKLRTQQAQVKSNEEYRSLEREIHTAQMEIKKLEDRELSIMESMEALRQDLATQEADLKKSESEIKLELIELDKRFTTIEDEIKTTEADRAGLLGDVPGDWLARYERVFKHNREYGIVPIENGACGGCHMKLPAQVFHDTKKGLKMILCNFCGAILYWKP